MAETTLIIIGMVVVLAIIIAVIAASSQRRTARLHRTFGPEYDRTVATAGDRGVAEQELAGRVDRRGRFTIVPLSDAARQEYAMAWRQIQADFVDAPAQSVQAADVLVARVMSDRGYPMTDFDQRAADISVDHPDVVENYRLAHDACLSSGRGQATTEDLRRAMTQYRALFDRLLAAGDTGLTQQQSASAPPPPVYSAAGVGGSGTPPPAAPAPPEV
jgi:hypothetical protein